MVRSIFPQVPSGVAGQSAKAVGLVKYRGPPNSPARVRDQQLGTGKLFLSQSRTAFVGSAVARSRAIRHEGSRLGCFLSIPAKGSFQRVHEVFIMT